MDQYEIRDFIEEKLDEIFKGLVTKLDLKTGDVDMGWTNDYESLVDELEKLVKLWIERNR